MSETITKPKGKTITTYSMWAAFRNCRKKCWWRYVQELVPLEQPEALTFGALIHRCLEVWHTTSNIETVTDYINQQVNRNGEDWEHRFWHLATAMMTGYARTYPQEEWTPVVLEQTFRGPIVNPVSGWSSHKTEMQGKIDGIVIWDGEHWLLEHKTAARIDAGYIERIWADFQVFLYAHYARVCFGYDIKGVVYNVLQKVKLKQREGETEAEFQQRHAELCARNKNGTSTARRRMPETDEEYQARLLAAYADTSCFHREIVLIEERRIKELQAEIWDLNKSYLDAVNNDRWYQNPSHCFHWNRRCPYEPLCSAANPENLIDSEYRHETPHQELNHESPIF